VEDFRAIAQQIADDILTGRLVAGDRLPPQRIFAHRRGIAPSTASRVYDDLRRRGLVVGETGRGTFVRAVPPSNRPALSEPQIAQFNLDTNYPVLADQHLLLSAGLRQMALNPELLQRSLREVSVRGTVTLRDSVAHAMSGSGHMLTASSLLFTGNGKQAIAATLSALASTGDRVGFEALTYPLAKAIATKLGLAAVPIAMDAQGLIPEALEAAHRASPLRAVYVQPTLHNPLGVTMPSRRRQELAKTLLRMNDVIAVEDSVYGFLDDMAPPPLSTFAPEHTIFLDSLSKRVGPGLTLGIISAPERHIEALSNAIVTGAWGAGGFAMEICSRWLADGTIAALEADKRREAIDRQTLAQKALSGFRVRANRHAYHLYLELPDKLRADEFVQAVAARGIAITPASAFSVSASHAPNAVRIGLANLRSHEIQPLLTNIVNVIAESTSGRN